MSGPEDVLDAIEAMGALLREVACAHCEVQVEVLARSDGGSLPKALGIRHQPGCPDWLPD